MFSYKFVLTTISRAMSDSMQKNARDDGFSNKLARIFIKGATLLWKLRHPNSFKQFLAHLCILDRHFYVALLQ